MLKTIVKRIISTRSVWEFFMLLCVINLIIGFFCLISDLIAGANYFYLKVDIGIMLFMMVLFSICYVASIIYLLSRSHETAKQKSPR